MNMNNKIIMPKFPDDPSLEDWNNIDLMYAKIREGYAYFSSPNAWRNYKLPFERYIPKKHRGDCVNEGNGCLPCTMDSLIELSAREAPEEECKKAVEDALLKHIPTYYKYLEEKKKYENSVGFAYCELMRLNDHITNDHAGNPNDCDHYEPNGKCKEKFANLETQKSYVQKVYDATVPILEKSIAEKKAKRKSKKKKNK